MIEFTVTIGGSQYQLKATDRKLLSLINSFDDRLIPLIKSGNADQVTLNQVQEIISLDSFLDDRKLEGIDRWLESQQAPKLTESASILEVANLFQSIMLKVTEALTRNTPDRDNLN